MSRWLPNWGRLSAEGAASGPSPSVSRGRPQAPYEAPIEQDARRQEQKITDQGGDEGES